MFPYYRHNSVSLHRCLSFESAPAFSLSQWVAARRTIHTNSAHTRHIIMSEINKLLENNRLFLRDKGHERHRTDSGIPSRSVLILSCMDTRLSVMLYDALGIENGECKVVKVAGGIILDDYDSVMRSIIVGIYELGVKEIMVIHHTDCGAGKMHGDHVKAEIARRLPPERLEAAGKVIDIGQWLEGFGHTESSVHRTICKIKNHPLVPRDIIVRGFIIDSETGELVEID